MSNAQHIVVVDDEASAREMVGDYLKMHGFDVTLCDGGRSLRASLQVRRADLVVLDLNMPEEDGLSIVRDLKAKHAVPIIMLTATASAIDRGRELIGARPDLYPFPAWVAASREECRTWVEGVLASSGPYAGRSRR